MTKKKTTPTKAGRAARVSAQPAFGAPPKPEDIERTRKEAKIRQDDAAWLLHRSLRAWEEWESGRRPMPAALWEYFVIQLKAIALRAAGSITEDQLKALGITLPRTEVPRYSFDHLRIHRGAP